MMHALAGWLAGREEKRRLEREAGRREVEAEEAEAGTGKRKSAIWSSSFGAVWFV